jgi:hypothetical protein
MGTEIEELKQVVAQLQKQVTRLTGEHSVLKHHSLPC